MRLLLPLLLLTLAACEAEAPADPAAGAGGAPAELPPSPAACLADPACGRGMTSAHRAKCGGGAPENTLAGVRDCTARRVPILELDPRQTADGEVILMHDAEADRTTDAAARFPGRTRIEELTAAEIATLRVRHEACEAADADPAACHVPTLREVLQEPSDAVLMLDFKSGDVDVVAALVNEAGVAERVLFFDGSLENLTRFQQLVPGAQVMPRIGSAEEAAALLASPDAPAELRWLHGDAGYAAEAIAALEGSGVRLYVDVFHLDVGLYAAESAMEPAEAAAYLNEEVWPKLDALRALGVGGYGTERAEQLQARLTPDGWERG